MITNMKSGLGTIKTSEMRVLIIFLVTAMLWITRDIINDIPGLEGLSDPGIAMLCGLALFLTPVKALTKIFLNGKMHRKVFHGEFYYYSEVACHWQPLHKAQVLQLG